MRLIIEANIPKYGRKLPDAAKEDLIEGGWLMAN
jgi:hypothetical protein